MNKIKAKVFTGEPEARTCSISGKAYNQVPGLEYFRTGADAEGLPVEEYISPSAAIRAGFTFDEKLKVPGNVKSKSELTLWLRSLGLRPGSENYRNMYAEHSVFYPF